MHCHALQSKDVIYCLLYQWLMSLESIPVSSTMTKNVIVQTEDQTIQAISRTMFENNIGNVLIIRNNTLGNNIGNQYEVIGIIPKKDLVRLTGLFDKTLNNILEQQLMIKPVISITSRIALKNPKEKLK